MGRLSKYPEKTREGAEGTGVSHAAAPAAQVATGLPALDPCQSSPKRLSAFSTPWAAVTGLILLGPHCTISETWANPSGVEVC